MHLHHDIAQLKLRIEALIDLPVCLSGSGSTLYCLFDANTIEAMDRYRRTLTTEIGCRCVAVCNNDW
jgi:homoserine kinase